jgi:hypothetical protein
MNPFQIEISNNGISIRKGGDRTLVDPLTGEQIVIPQPLERGAVGLGDFCQNPCAPTEEELEAFRIEVGKLFGGMVGPQFAQFAIDVASYQSVFQAQANLLEMYEQEIKNAASKLARVQEENDVLKSNIASLTTSLETKSQLLHDKHIEVASLKSENEKAAAQVEDLNGLLEVQQNIIQKQTEELKAAQDAASETRLDEPAIEEEGEPK